MLDNLPNRGAAWLVQFAAFPFGVRRQGAPTGLSAAVARGLLDDRALRLAMTPDVYIPPSTEGSLGRLEAAYAKVVAAQPVDRKLKEAPRSRRIPAHLDAEAQLAAAISAGVISEDERLVWREADTARRMPSRSTPSSRSSRSSPFSHIEDFAWLTEAPGTYNPP